MARVFPPELGDTIRSAPGRRAECQLYDLLSQLPDPYHVFYGVRWQSVGRYGARRDGEADFVIAHPDRGIMILEVKGGQVEYRGHVEGWVSLSPLGQPRRGSRDPVAQAAEARHAFLAYLTQSPRWRHGLFALTYAVALPDIVLPADVALPIAASAEVMLDSRSLGDIGAAIERVWQYWQAETPACPLGADRLSRLVELLEGRLVLPLAPERRPLDRRLAEQLLELVARHRRGRAALWCCVLGAGLLLLSGHSVLVNRRAARPDAGASSLQTPGPSAAGRIYFVSRHDGRDSIGSVRPDGTDYRLAFRGPAGHQLHSPALEPGGRRMAYALSVDGGQTGEIRIRHLETGIEQALRPERLPGEPCWLRGDGLAFVENGVRKNVVTAALASGWVRPVTDVRHAAGPAVSPDGAWLVYAKGGADDEALYIRAVDGGQPRKLLDIRCASWPAWSPDGAQIAFLLRQGGEERRRLYVVNADGSNPTLVGAAPGSHGPPAWSADGQWLVFTSSQDDALYAIRPDGTGLRQMGSGLHIEGRPAWWPAPPWREPVADVLVTGNTTSVQRGRTVRLRAVARDDRGRALTWPRFAWYLPKGGGRLTVTGRDTAALAVGEQAVRLPEVVATTVVAGQLTASHGGSGGP